MKNPLLNFLRGAGIFLFTLLGAANVFGAVGFTVTPNLVSNTYFGPITLTVTGLTSGATVVMQKFADINTNGVIDTSDYLVQQFNLTDGQAGQVIGGVTNIDVPGDTDTTAGQITARVNFRPDFIQILGGKYLFKLSSPTAQFAPVTNSFTVTNFPFPQKFTGTVSSGSALPYAIVMLFPPPRGGDHGPGNPEYGAVANSLGVYTIPAPAGSYSLVAFKTNYVGNFSTAPTVALGSGATVSTNLSLTIATASISGKLEDASSSVGIPGTLTVAQTQTQMLGIGFTDTNGNYTVRVTANDWQMNNPSGGGLCLHGYVPPATNADVSTTGGNASNINLPISKATALFYGRLTDTNGVPLPSEIAVEAYDNNQNNGGSSTYQSDGYTDSNGNFTTTAIGGLGTSDQWNVNVDNSSSFPNEIFSNPAFDGNGGTNILAGQTVPVTILYVVATNVLSGHVETSSGRSITNVQVYASDEFDGQVFNTQVDTDANGNYAMNMSDGIWSVGVECQSNGNGDSLDEILGAGNYLCPNGEAASIVDTGYETNFVVTLCGAVTVATTNLPEGQVDSYYDNFLNASSCNGNFTWTTNSGGALPNGLTLDPSGEIQGTPTVAGTNHFSVHVVDGNNDFTNQSLTIIIAGAPLSITTSSPLPNGGNGVFYSQTLQAGGGQTPYVWSVPNYSANPPPNLSLSPGGVLSGTLTTNGTFYFYARVTDATNGTFDQQFSITITNQTLQVFTFQLPNAIANASYSAQLVATNGQPPYTWGYGPGSAALPANLSLAPSGLISGIPLTNGLFSFIVQATDANFDTATQMLGLIVNPKPSLGATKSSGTQFQFVLNGVSNQNYTVQVSTNLTSLNWSTLVITNSTSTNSFQIIDPHATNADRYYRVLIGP